jgi:hypothetical protein
MTLAAGQLPRNQLACGMSRGGPLDTSFLGFPVYKGKSWDGSQVWSCCFVQRKLITIKPLAVFSIFLLPLWSIGPISQFLDRFTDGRTHSTGGQLVARPLPKNRTTQTQNKRIHTHKHQTSMPWVGFESMIPASERAKTVHVLDRSATVIGPFTVFFLVSPTLGSLLPLLEHRSESPQFLDQGQSVGLLGRASSSSQGLYLYTNTEKFTHIHKH